MLVCKALLHDGEIGSVYRLATPCENCDLAKFTAAETLCADVAMAKMHTFSLAFSTSFHRVRCDIRGHQIRLHRYGPRVGKQALLAILARANVVVLRETYDPNNEDESYTNRRGASGQYCTRTKAVVSTDNHGVLVAVTLRWLVLFAKRVARTPNEYTISHDCACQHQCVVFRVASDLGVGVRARRHPP